MKSRHPQVVFIG